ncbi:MAG: cyclic nucleotide-binding domain-containing protein [Candidatus Magnetobacterium sp. LHC-1]|uniref:Cyclic nucleotide-binding domain-containing protein n=1 Tax=Candidatus Magnetobacterium casense TaxID=1455061 RepID=A0ABS6RYR3_9BACT|nr:cyclic nucleotide-binding domain-containing protein [Candidatus Magnetobacterium casensis]MBF0607182.1 cyclic nucleotide-binding domain-containing protein [Nitrospirota bacterium]MBV6341557.1 cyclic nucleotide-binding domain-containing protein [Candidatus Magnetobacterium casensis]
MDRGLKIFISISELAVSDITKGGLSYLGFINVHAVNNTSTALGALLRDKVDVLISDYANLKMEGEGGNLLKAIRSHQELARLKIVLLATKEIDVNELKQLYKEGINAIVKYPFQINDLVKGINDAVRSVQTQVSDTFTKIRQLDFFSFMNDEEVLKLLKMTKCRKYEGGEIIFDEGQPGDRFYVIIEGSMLIIKVLDDDNEEVLARLERGACFGEMAIVENTTRSARARTDDGVLLFELDSKLMDGYDDIVTLKLFKKLAYVFSDRLRNADQKIRELALYSYAK